MVFGWGLVTATTYVLIASAAMLIWFRFVQIPFEESELCALFGDQVQEIQRKYSYASSVHKTQEACEYHVLTKNLLEIPNRKQSISR